jgi:hypothetical protein
MFIAKAPPRDEPKISGTTFYRRKSELGLSGKGRSAILLPKLLLVGHDMLSGRRPVMTMRAEMPGDQDGKPRGRRATPTPVVVPNLKWSGPVNPLRGRDRDDERLTVIEEPGVGCITPAGASIRSGIPR